MLAAIHLTTTTAPSSSIQPPEPAVIRVGNKISLADHLDLHNLPMAATAGGKSFAIKALHPAETTIRTTRLPGGNRASTCVTCDMIETIPVTNPAMFTTIYSFPSPSVPVTYCIGSAEGLMDKSYGAFGNSAFGSAHMTNPDAAFYDNATTLIAAACEQYRVLAQSVTIELVAPAVQNQGTIICAQITEKPQKFHAGSLQPNGFGMLPYDVAPPAVLYDKPPTSAKMLLGSNAYTSTALDGVYAPLKLSKLRFKTSNRPSICYGAINGVAVPTKHFSLNAANIQSFPYPGLDYSADVALFQSWSCPEYTKIVVAGLAAGVALRVRVRQCLEIIPYPGTVYASLVSAPLPPDELSVKMYFEISGKMKDGYPASYNDLGKLRDFVDKAAHELLPFVDPALDALLSLSSLIPGVAPFTPLLRPLKSEVVKQLHVFAAKSRKKQVIKKPPTKRS